MSEREVKRRFIETFDNMGADKFPPEEFRYVGRRGVRRIDGAEKAGGQAVYTMDVDLPGMLKMRFLTCPYPHAEIASLDTRRAEALPGVRAVLRHDDPELPPVADLGGHIPSELPVLARCAHFQGEEVGLAVAADTEDIALAALDLVEVEWRQRPFVLDVTKALEPDAPLACPEFFPHDNRMNAGLEEEKQGDVEAGFAASERVIEFQSIRDLHTWIGPERPCGVFRWNGPYPELWVKQQRPHVAKRVVSSWFGGIPMNHIQMHCLYQGASFGGWSQAAWNMAGHYCAALISKRTGRPVKWIFDRREDFFGGQMDHGVYHLKVGFNSDGTILAVQVRAVLANLMFPMFGVAHHFVTNTCIPNVQAWMDVVAVNKGPTMPTRCEQNSNAHTLTLVFDRVATELEMDPIEVALKNDGAHGHDAAWLIEHQKELGFTPRDSLRECVDRGRAVVGWDEKWHPPGTKRLPNGRMHGLGFTWNHEWDDSSGSSEMAIRIERNDATATIYAMRADNGVNAETTYCQIAADELGLKVADVYYRPQHDTGFFAMTPDSSTNTSINGFAIRHAARLLKHRILKAATSPRGESQRFSFPPAFPDCTPDDLDLKDGIIIHKQDPSQRMSLAEFVGASGAEGPVNCSEMAVLGLERTWFSGPLFAYGWHVQQGTYSDVRVHLCRQAHFMEVEVDPETGQVLVTRVVNVNDVGKVLNWDGCEGQQYGGTYMGAGRGLLEAVVHDPVTGVMLNGNLIDYKIATMLDVGPVDTALVETALGYGPYGLVGIGEDVATVVPALLGPAVYNALGVWVNDFPITPDRVLAALKGTDAK
jgi:xanthine dehydrogenase molybdenum-binding subunit